jgi:Domain of unknown function (DUF2828)
MNTFANAISNQHSRTENGMKARASSANACVDLFYSIGASRGKDIVPAFIQAYAENKEVALRIAQWARDVRGGAGERQLYKNILGFLESKDMASAIRLANKTPEIGRWDDLLAFQTPAVKNTAFSLIANALREGNGLCAKWMPRKGTEAVELRKHLGLSPKQYRKLLVGLTQVVETQMCAKDWQSIEFNHVPSLAAARYRNAFKRNAGEVYDAYVTALASPENTQAKVNVGAVYPYDVLKSALIATKPYGYNGELLDTTDLAFINAQWNAMPNFVGDNKVLPMVDVSGSMECPAGGSGSLSCMDVALSLGLYCADKNTGPFKDIFLTFSSQPELLKLSGSVTDKLRCMNRSNWEMNTDLIAAIDKILSVAKGADVPANEMPNMLLVLSDMQFDHCAKFDDSALQAFQRRYEAAGYALPKIVFWNLNAYSNVPVSSHQSGVALVSGFSPNLMTSLLAGDLENFTPEAIMLKTVMVPRYDF